ncbi:MAG: c-type cytochrome domain-containing protein [Limisphaerales bacterium]
MRRLLPFIIGLALASGGMSHAADYAAVHALFEVHCIDCHSSQEPDGNFIMENFAALMRGGESGRALIPGKSSESLLVKYIEGNVEKEGKKRFMPPGNRKKLSSNEIALIKQWIDAGAQPPAEEIVKELRVLTIEPRIAPPKRILALAASPDQKLYAAAHYGDVAIISADNQRVLHVLAGSRSSVNDVVFSPDGKYLFAASGENAIAGEVKQWDVTLNAFVRTYEGHRDILYSVAISPEGKILATGSYDQNIILWNTETGAQITKLTGHNGAVFGLAFRPDGKILASASADRTVKLWNVARGERVETFSQPTKEVQCLAWSPDGKFLYAGGRDNRIRVWQVSESAVETTNPILVSRFAHEGTILRLCISRDGKSLISSADDHTVKVWDTASMRERFVLEKQTDWATGIAINEQKIVVGRLDGTYGTYDLNGESISIPAKPPGN